MATAETTTQTFPTVYYSTTWHVPPVVVTSQAQADALDPTQWTTIPPAAEAKPEQFPQIYYDINVPPVVVNSAEDLKALDQSRYRKFQMTQAIVDAATANLQNP